MVTTALIRRSPIQRNDAKCCVADAVAVATTFGLGAESNRLVCLSVRL